MGIKRWATATPSRRRISWAVVAATVAATVAVGTMVVNASTEAAHAVARFTDSFDGAVDGDATYGLAGRQRSEQHGVPYTRVSGVASPPVVFPGQPPQPARYLVVLGWSLGGPVGRTGDGGQ